MCIYVYILPLPRRAHQAQSELDDFIKSDGFWQSWLEDGGNFAMYARRHFSEVDALREETKKKEN